jgi:hypothetical protein
VVDAGTVTFNVSWKNTGMPAVWSDTVWVWVDYNNAGKLERLPLLPGATLTATSAPSVGKVMEAPGNHSGVWVVGNAKTAGAGSFSATIKLLTATADLAGVCVYASNYPPMAKYTDATHLSFTGTPMYTMVLSDGRATHTAYSYGTYALPEGHTMQSFIDKTGAPGQTQCMPAEVYDLKVSNTAYCAGSSVTFALSNTAAGKTYRLYKNNSPVDAIAATTGGAATFTGAFAGAGTYTAHADADGEYCATAMRGTFPVNENSPTAPVISKPTDVCLNGGDMVFTATGYSGTLEWTQDGGGTPSGHSITFASGAATGTKTVAARSAQTYSGGLTCYSATVTQSATVNPLPVISSVSGNARCNAGEVTLVAALSGGITDVMTYTWTIGSIPYITDSNSHTTTSLSSSAAYTVKTVNANLCESSPLSGTIAINFPGGNNQSASPCGCATGTINCSGTCKTDATYTTNDGSCTGSCTRAAYVQLRNACSTVIDSRYSTYSNSGCYASDYTTNDGSCTGQCGKAYKRLRSGCDGSVKDHTYSTYNNSSCTSGCCTTADYTRNDGACASCGKAYVRLYDGCTGNVKNSQYSTYNSSSCMTPYTTKNDGACTGECGKAYVRQYNCDGTVRNSQYSTYSNSSCLTPYTTKADGACTGECGIRYMRQYNCDGTVRNSQYSTIRSSSCCSACRNQTIEQKNMTFDQCKTMLNSYSQNATYTTCYNVEGYWYTPSNRCVVTLTVK